MELTGLLKLATAFEDDFDIAKYPENYQAGELTRNQDGSYQLSVLEIPTNKELTFDIPERRARNYSSEAEYKEFFEQADKIFNVEITKKQNERRSKIKRKMREGLVGLIVGITLIGSASLTAFLIYSRSPITGYKRACELDAKAAQILPKDDRKYFCNINGNEVKVERLANNARTVNYLQIKINERFGFLSEMWCKLPGSPDGDARNVESILINDEKNGWQRFYLEEVGNPKELQQKYESLIEKIYEQKLKNEKKQAVERKAKLEEAKKTIQDLTSKI